MALTPEWPTRESHLGKSATRERESHSRQNNHQTISLTPQLLTRESYFGGHTRERVTLATLAPTWPLENHAHARMTFKRDTL